MTRKEAIKILEKELECLICNENGFCNTDRCFNCSLNFQRTLEEHIARKKELLKTLIYELNEIEDPERNKLHYKVY